MVGHVLGKGSWDNTLRQNKNAIFHRCIDCTEVISNPVCSECLGNQMKQVLGEIDPALPDRIVTSNFAGDTHCISCGSEMGLCAHCFSKDIYYQIKDVNSVAAEEFLARFDYDLRVMFC
ncbi:hypothetical protein CL619_00870 [archaeon]|nr:hypothetical protein [archaeon]|tara:strand:- start:6 stop:362 length:357 start_codon:yes stop_codon:yes gene_type:complete